MTPNRTSAIRVNNGAVLRATDAEMSRIWKATIEEAKTTIASFGNGGSVIKYKDLGEYNNTDIKDLENIAEIKARNEGSQVEIMPKIDAKNPLYSEMYPELKGTIYERKCPDLRVTTTRGGKKYVEYESFARPFKPRDLSRMINRGSKQASSLIIDIRETNITKDFVQRQIKRNLGDPDFKRPIHRVWTYDGKKLNKVH